MVVAAPAPELPVGARTASTVHPAQPVPRHWSTAGTLGLLAIAVITNLALLAALTATNHQTTSPAGKPRTSITDSSSCQAAGGAACCGNHIRRGKVRSGYGYRSRYLPDQRTSGKTGLLLGAPKRYPQ
jgi:hypothetical protein